jgi:hypothetical protein
LASYEERECGGGDGRGSIGKDLLPLFSKRKFRQAAARMQPPGRKVKSMRSVYHR